MSSQGWPCSRFSRRTMTKRIPTDPRTLILDPVERGIHDASRRMLRWLGGDITALDDPPPPPPSILNRFNRST